MTALATAWAPPPGSRLVEPGVWEAPNGGIYVDPVVNDEWQAERETANERYAAWRRHERAKPVVPHRDELIAQLHVLRNCNEDLCRQVDHLRRLLEIAIDNMEPRQGEAA
jgi:hypothetical protein